MHNYMASINRGLYFDLDDRGLRCHEKQLFKRRFHLDVRRFVFSNRVVDNWNSLSAQYVIAAIRLSSIFTARRFASAVLATAIPSVCLSVCHTPVVSKRRHVA